MKAKAMHIKKLLIVYGIFFRNYVYYWIVRSEQEDDTDSLAVATLYSLTYRYSFLKQSGHCYCQVRDDMGEVLLGSHQAEYPDSLDDELGF